MPIDQLIALVKNEGLKTKLNKTFTNKSNPSDVLKYIVSWKENFTTLRFLASIFSFGIIPLVYFLVAKYRNRPHTNWITKPSFDTNDAIKATTEACELYDSSEVQTENESQELSDLKFVLKPHDSTQSQATLMTIHRKKLLVKMDFEMSEEKNAQEFKKEQRNYASILANGRIFASEKYTDNDGNSRNMFNIYDEKNKFLKRCFHVNEEEDNGLKKFPLVSQPGEPVFIFTNDNNKLLISNDDGDVFMTIKRTNIPKNAHLIPSVFHFKDNKFFVFLIAENEGIITLYKFSNDTRYNSSTQLLDASPEKITAITYNSANAMAYAIDTNYQLHSIKTNPDKSDGPIIESALTEIPNGTQIIKLALSLDGHLLYAAGSDGYVYYYEINDSMEIEFLDSQKVDEGEILDIKCFDDPKYIDKEKKLLIVTTQGAYSELMNEYSPASTAQP